MQIPKLVVFDVDGTLLDSRGECQPRTRGVLDRLRQRGVVIAIATGRPLALAEHTIDRIGGADWAACGNGAALLEVGTGRLHRDSCLPTDLVEPLVRSLRNHLPGVGFTLETTAGVIEEHGFARRVPPSPHDPPVDDALATWGASRAGVRKIIPFHDHYDQNLDDLAAIVARFADDRCELQYGMLPFVEVASAGDHKAVALEVLIAHLGIAAVDVVAFGDGGNDIEMLQWAGVGVAMGNARHHVRAVADVVTDHVDDAGVAHFLEPLLTDS